MGVVFFIGVLFGLLVLYALCMWAAISFRLAHRPMMGLVGKVKPHGIRSVDAIDEEKVMKTLRKGWRAVFVAKMPFLNFSQIFAACTSGPD